MISLINFIAYFLKDIDMRTFDFSPLYRSAIGYDRLANMFERAQRGAELGDGVPTYPPYNIELIADDKYRITMAVAGFQRSEIDLELEGDSLKVVGRKERDEQTKSYLHRGIAARNFEHRFQLAEHVKVVSASLDAGLLNIELAREVPEAMKPRKIAINNTIGDAIGSASNDANHVDVLERRAA
jgi:molecular chaperone IbpA